MCQLLPCMHTDTYTCIHVYTVLYTCKIHMYVYMCIYIHTHTHLYRCIHIYIHIQIYMYTWGLFDLVIIGNNCIIDGLEPKRIEDLSFKGLLGIDEKDPKRQISGAIHVATYVGCQGLALSRT